MKKIILSLVLAATAFNGWLAASGSASLSTSDLQVDDVEMVAEGESTRRPKPPVSDELIKKIAMGIVTAYEVGKEIWDQVQEYLKEEEDAKKLDGWMCDIYDSYTYQKIGWACLNREQCKSPDCKL